MKKIKLKKSAVYGIYTGVFLLLLVALYYVSFSNSKLNSTPKDGNDYKYVSRLFGEDVTPVVGSNSTIIRPYLDSKVKVLQGFYDYKASESDQENSIINYEQTYIQNNGVIYGGIDDGFDVISVLDGTVTSVKKDNLLGSIVEIKNSDKVITVYQGLSDVNVKENDTVKQGMIIGKSGDSNMNKDAGKHVTFELKIDGVYVDPESYYNKDINKL